MRLKITFLFFLFPMVAFCQNLVLNPSFEEQKYCANLIGMFTEVTKDWSTPNVATTDLLNKCSNEDPGVPSNFMGTQRAKDGENYAGCFFLGDRDYREYVQGTLSQTLEKGKKYRVSFYLNLAENSAWSVKHVGFLLTEKKLKLPIGTNLSKTQLRKHNIEKFSAHVLSSDTFYNDPKNWVELSVEITAQGFENFITIGNLEDDSHSEKQATAGKNKINSYYYIDLVSVEPIEKAPEPKIETGKTYVLQHVNFEFGRYELSDEAKTELKELYDFISADEKRSIAISGHTDNIGKKETNVSISKKRAKTVADFLIELGLSPNRLTSNGFGDSKPVADNTSEEGRRQNRRVEFRID